MTRLEFTVPFVPRALSPNERGGWQSHQLGPKGTYRKLVAEAAGDALAMARKRGPRDLIIVNLTFGIKAAGLLAAERLTYKKKDRPYRPTDEANAVAAWKPGFDGLVDAGLVVDDTYKHLHLGDITIDPALYPIVIVSIEL